MFPFAERFQPLEHTRVVLPRDRHVAYKPIEDNRIRHIEQCRKNFQFGLVKLWQMQRRKRAEDRIRFPAPAMSSTVGELFASYIGGRVHNARRIARTAARG